MCVNIIQQCITWRAFGNVQWGWIQLRCCGRFSCGSCPGCGSCICSKSVPPMLYEFRWCQASEHQPLCQLLRFWSFLLRTATWLQMGRSKSFEDAGRYWNSEGHTGFENWKGEFMWLCREIVNILKSFYGHFNQEHHFLSYQTVERGKG